METNLYYCTRTGRTTLEKTMEDGNINNTRDDKIGSTSLANFYCERTAKLTSNGHEFAGESSSPSESVYEPRRSSAETLQDDKFKKRINPLKIHLGKRPFVDTSVPYNNNAYKKKKHLMIKPSESIVIKNSIPRAPKLIPKRVECNLYHNAKSQAEASLENEQDKPVPRLVPKSQLLQFKKGKIEKGAHLKQYAQSLGLQPMVKFKCRKCCSMSFKTLAMLKEHQLICRAQAKEPALSPESAPNSDNNAGGPSRVTRKVYLCSACGTYYENWNLFLHMREVHNRHICLFCLGMFSKAEKLSSHLTNKHNVQEFNYNSKEEFFNIYNGTLYLMCCVCDEICSEQDDFFNHDCNNVKPKPVPVLVSKNTVKPGCVKYVKNGNELMKNGSSMTGKELVRPSINNKTAIDDEKSESFTPQKATIEAATCDRLNSDASITSDSSVTNSKEKNNVIDSVTGTESSNTKSVTSIHEANSNELSKLYVPNGDDSIETSDDSDSPVSDETQPFIENSPPNTKENSCQPLEREKECGIKLKLSLNNANSPVIINSTVDPTVGQQYANKPPTRVRRPPKRYERDSPKETSSQLRPPSIKMTICDKADSPFVKTTFIESNEEITLKANLNNSLNSDSPVPKDVEAKSEKIVKTTIYDNKLEDSNTLNRVPKLTVRVPKEFLDKNSSSDYSSDSDVSDKLTVDEKNMPAKQHDEAKEETMENETIKLEKLEDDTAKIKEEPGEQKEEKVKIEDEIIASSTESKTEPKEEDFLNVEEPCVDDTPVTELTLDKPLDKYPLKDLLKVFLASTIVNCIYCNHARKIAVNCQQLALHMVAEHRFSATVDSITAEELMPETIAAKVKARAVEVCSVFINLDTYDSVDKCEDVQYTHIFECYQCFFKTAVLKDLYLHNRKMHQKTILLCIMCKSNFYTYSELLCHLCPGTYDSEYEIKFRCCLCNVDSISSSFRLMVHLRKIHHACDVCLELCQSQARLSNHVWKHKLHHLCYRCGIAYRNKPDITNHLFWKHGTESVLCKKCLQKKWPHVYHFCIPPAVFACEECTLQFSRAVCLKVHKRFHSGDFPHVCTEEGCTEKFVSKKLLAKHTEEHKKKLLADSLVEGEAAETDKPIEASKEPVPVIDLIDKKPEEAGTSEVKEESGTEQICKKTKKKKLKDKDALLLDVNLPALNLSESDSSDESDSGIPSSIKEEGNLDKTEEESQDEIPVTSNIKNSNSTDIESTPSKVEEKIEDSDPLPEDKPDEKQVLEIWDNFKKYQAKVEKQREKTPPLVPIRKHVCESDHDYCLVPTDVRVDDDQYNSEKKKSKKTKKSDGGLSSSSSSSSDSDSSCSCGSNCSCSSSSGSSSSSSSDSDSSDESSNEKKKVKKLKKSLPNRRISNGSNVDVMGLSETPVLVPEKTEPLIAESDLETDESETDEEFYDENPQLIANKLYAEKRNQVMPLTCAAPTEGGSISKEICRATTPIKEEAERKETNETVDKNEQKEKSSSGKKRSKKKKKSKSSKKHAPIKINIPKDVIAKSEVEPTPPLPPNKITISLQSNTVHLPEAPKEPPVTGSNTSKPTGPHAATLERKRASKRRRVPNKFYGYSSDEESHQVTAALKPQQPPKLEWRKEDLPSPVTHKAKKEIPSSVIPQRVYNYTEPIRLTTPIPDPEPPKILMNSESMESSDSDSSDEGALEIYQPSGGAPNPLPPPTYLNSGTSSLPYAFQRPAARQAREGESVYCYCRCPYDEVSEMIACDADGCPIEWFHFECVGIMVPPKGKWYCPECRKNQSFSGCR